MTDMSSTGSNDTVRVVLDGEVLFLRGVDPTRTVLQWLREDLGRTGTKEGCAEGDCGACTVVVGELTGDELALRPVNACIRFLPTLDGKALFTVESLSPDATRPHPVQRAMVDRHGSQCGFCTPGIVMSLFALFKNDPAPTRAAAADALVGNLCRCTGYGPILAAATDATASAAHASADGSWLALPAGVDRAHPDRGQLMRTLARLQHDAPLAIEHGGRRFLAPCTLDELAEALARHPEATLLAGGTDVGLWVTKHLRTLATIVYTGRVAALCRVEQGPDAIVIGSAVPLADLHALLAREFPSLGELFARFASPPIRSSATLGGNVANGSPIGDSMPALIALGATVDLRRGATMRTLPLEDLYLGYRKTAMETGEFVVSIRIPRLRSRTKFATYKVSKRFDQDISAVCGAFAVDVEDGRVRSARIVFGGMAPIPRRAQACERALSGAVWDESAVRRAMHVLDSELAPIDDMRASRDYRSTVARNLLWRFYHESSSDSTDVRLLPRAY